MSYICNENIYVSSHKITIGAFYENPTNGFARYVNHDQSVSLVTKIHAENNEGLSLQTLGEGNRLRDITIAQNKSKKIEPYKESIWIGKYGIMPGFKEVQPSSEVQAYCASANIGKVKFTGVQQLLDIDNFKPGDILKLYWIDACNTPPVIELNDKPISCWTDASILQSAFGLPHSWQSTRRDERLAGFTALCEYFSDNPIVSERLQKLLPFFVNETKYGNQYQEAWREYLQIARKDEQEVKQIISKIDTVWKKLLGFADEYEKQCAPLTFTKLLEGYNYHEKYLKR